MNKINIILICAVFLALGIGIVVSQTTLQRTDSTIEMNSNKLNTLKTKLGVSAINPTLSVMTCDNRECWSEIRQDGVIQTEFRVSKYECLKANITTGDCIMQREYTSTELQKMRDEYVRLRLETFADYLDNKTIVMDEVVGEGRLTFVNPK
jgi:hypothetical protein